MHKLIPWILCTALLLSACTSSHQTDQETRRGEFLPNAFAANYRIAVNNADTVLVLFNPSRPDDTLKVYPVSKEAIRLATVSTTHLPMMRSLQAMNQLVGAGYTNYVTDQDVHERLADGRLREITSSDKLNFEVVIDLQPDVLLVYPYGNENYSRYEQAGIDVLPISEYAEAHPLGRAEWIKVFGLLTGNYSQACRVFDALTEAYEATRKKASEASNPPLVFTGSFYKGRWSAPGGDSFVARFIEDAGGQYAFAEYPGSENVELDFERVLEKISSADFFGKVLHREEQVTRDDFLEENRRFELLNDFTDEQLFYCNSYTSDYFGRGLLEPHLILADLHQIFHLSAEDSLSYQYFKPLSHREE